MLYDRVQVKLAAKEAVRTARPRPWVVVVLYYLLTVVAVNVVTALVPSPTSGMAMAALQDPAGFAENPLQYMDLGMAGGLLTLSIFISVLATLYETVMGYGYVGYSLKLWRGGPTAYTDLFGGFPLAGKAIGASIMVAIFSFLWSLIPCLLFAVLLMVGIALLDTSAALGILLILCAVVVLVVGLLWVTYRYVLTPYFVMSDPDLGVFDAISASKNAMKGNKVKYFVLGLSFLGWELLAGVIGWIILLVGFLIIFAGNFAAISGGMEPMLLLATAGVPAVLVMILAAVAATPLLLWLTAYRGAAFAGFFDTVTGASAQPEPAVETPYEEL